MKTTNKATKPEQKEVTTDNVDKLHEAADAPKLSEVWDAFEKANRKYNKTMFKNIVYE